MSNPSMTESHSGKKGEGLVEHLRIPVLGDVHEFCNEDRAKAAARIEELEREKEAWANRSVEWHQRAEGLQRELAAMTADRDMWLKDSAKQNSNLGRVIAERDALRAARSAEGRGEPELPALAANYALIHELDRRGRYYEEGVQSFVISDAEYKQLRTIALAAPAAPSERPTPEVDAFFHDYDVGDYDHAEGEYRWIIFARRLERERDAARESAPLAPLAVSEERVLRANVASSLLVQSERWLSLLLDESVMDPDLARRVRQFLDEVAVALRHWEGP